MSIKLGFKYQDRLTGVEGYAYAIATYLTGYTNINLIKTGEDSDPGEDRWIDSTRLVEVGPPAFGFQFFLD